MSPIEWVLLYVTFLLVMLMATIWVLSARISNLFKAHQEHHQHILDLFSNDAALKKAMLMMKEQRP